MQVSVDIPNLIFRILIYLLVSLGYMGIFKKCGVKRIWAFVPLAKEYHISLCADREKDGRAYTIICALSYVLVAIEFLFKDNNTALMLMTIPLVGLFVADIIYGLKIYQGLIRVFDRNKRWIWAFFFFESLTIVIWGFSKKFQPTRQVENLKGVTGAKELGEDIKGSDDTLTVNIKKRTAIDFFKESYDVKGVEYKNLQSIMRF